MRNSSGARLHDGHFEVYLDEHGVRTQKELVGGGQVDLVGIADGGEIQLELAEQASPQDGSKIIAVFVGAIGEDHSAVAFGQLQVVGWKVGGFGASPSISEVFVFPPDEIAQRLFNSANSGLLRIFWGQGEEPAWQEMGFEPRTVMFFGNQYGYGLYPLVWVYLVNDKVVLDILPNTTESLDAVWTYAGPQWFKVQDDSGVYVTFRMDIYPSVWNGGFWEAQPSYISLPPVAPYPDPSLVGTGDPYVQIH